MIGWERVRTMLATSDIEPVVMSYSVCDQFPSVSAWNPATDDDGYPLAEVESAWEAMSRAEQFAACMPPEAMRITPSNLRTQGFGHGLSAFDVLKTLSRPGS